MHLHEGDERAVGDAGLAQDLFASDFECRGVRLIERGLAQAKVGNTIPAEDVLAQLQAELKAAQ
jgi:hypothetical protein